MLTAITRDVSPNIGDCELTFIDRQPIDGAVALRQLEDYRAALVRSGVQVVRLPADARYPDSCFVEDTAVVVDELAVITSMGAQSRRGEAPAVEAELSRRKKIARITLPATIEGGDVLRAGKRILVGLSGRTNDAGVRELARLLGPHGYSVTSVRTNGGLHFKSACTAIDDETLFVNRDCLRVDDLAGFKLVFTPEEEPAAANLLRVRDTLFVQAGFPRAAQTLRKLHHRVEELDTSEFRKAEAALTCLSVIFEDAA